MIMMTDILEHGLECKGEYKGVSWSMRRPYKTYWCGYVEYETDTLPQQYELTDEDIESLEGLSHGGLTSGIGFDCAHAGDYAPMEGGMVSSLFRGGMFRTHSYVYGRITDMIDYIVEAAQIAEKENTPPVVEPKQSDSSE